MVHRMYGVCIGIDNFMKCFEPRNKENIDNATPVVLNYWLVCERRQTTVHDIL